MIKKDKNKKSGKNGNKIEDEESKLTDKKGNTTIRDTSCR